MKTVAEYVAEGAQNAQEYYVERIAQLTAALTEIRDYPRPDGLVPRNAFDALQKIALRALQNA